MSTKNKKSVATQALLEMDEITSAIKEESRKSLKTMLAEAAKEALREACEDEDEDDYEVIDGDKEDAEDKKSKSKKSAKSDVDEQGNEDMENGVAPQGPEQQVPAEPQNPQMGAQEAPEDGMADAEGGSTADAEAPQDGEGNYGWDDASQYQVGNDTYDLTGENDYDNVVKVYKLLKDDDQVVVKKDGNTIQLQDGNAGTEYVIDLGSDDEDVSAEAVEGEEENPAAEEGLNEGFEFEVSDDEFDSEDDFDDFDDQDDNVAGFMDDGDDVEDEDNYEISNDSQPWDENEDEEDYEDFEDNSLEDKIAQLQQQIDALKGEQSEPAYAGMNENKKSRKPMKESKEVLFEVDLGYTDNYQDKDPIAGLSNNEPSKSGKSWHKGVPTGTSKPWAGQSKSKGDPFKETKKVEGSVNEMDEPNMAPEMGGEELEEANLSQSRWNDTHANGNRIPAANGDEYRRKGMQKTHKGNEYRATSTNESKDLKAVKKENKELKEAIIALRKNLNEAYITNVNLGKITKLFLENTTSLNEKQEIVNRFANEAKTVEQATALYESISKELKKNTNSMTMNESKTANGTKALNEEKVYKSNDLLKTIDLMKRMGC